MEPHKAACSLAESLLTSARGSFGDIALAAFSTTGDSLLAVILSETGLACLKIVLERVLPPRTLPEITKSVTGIEMQL